MLAFIAASLCIGCFSLKSIAADYYVIHGWPLLPEGEMLGAVTGVGIDSHDNVFVFHRAGRLWPASGQLDHTPIQMETVFVFEGGSGRLLDKWGANRFAMPHGLAVDSQDNVWLSDVALHQVYKFSHDGKPLLTLGERGIPANDSLHFNRPTDVAIAPDGSFYVSDGYINTRVLKFAPDGRFLFQWGTKGSGPGEFNLPHGIALDSSGRVFVADRSNARVQIFDSKGHYLSEWKGPLIGRPYDIAISREGNACIVDGGDQPPLPPDRSGVAVLDSNGRVLTHFARFGNYDGQLAMGHDIAVARDGSIYVGDITGRRIQKFSQRK